MSQNPDYFILSVANLTAEEAELFAASAFEAGAMGTEEALEFTQMSREYEPVTVEKERTQLKIYFEGRPSPAWIEEMKALYPQADFILLGEENRDWLAEWKKGFQPFRLAGETWVVPSWCEPPVEAKKIIRIDPGMAFGTGTHETTRLAAGFLADYARGATLLDVGTGTGILAMQAELLGFGRVTGNDVDAEARRVARENLALNETRHIEIVDVGLSQIAQGEAAQYDWVVANIIDGVLVKLQNDLKKCVKPQGHLLLTGILNERDSLFCQEFSFEGFTVVERRALGEWGGYLLKRA